MTGLVALLQRGMGLLGRLSMYRTVAFGLAVLAVVSLGLSFFGLVVPGPIDLLATAVVLVAAGSLTDVVAHRIVGTAWRPESTVVTSGILLFVLRPDADPAALAGAAVAAVCAAASKYVIAWRGRHLLNPAAVGATVVTALALAFPGLGGSAWWVATPALFATLVLVALLVAWRTERIGTVILFFVVGAVVFAAQIIVNLTGAGSSMTLDALVLLVTVQSPLLFLGAFMLTEPLTLPARRWQRLLVALVVAVLVGWPLSIGSFSLGQERALLIGNLLAVVLVGGRRRISLAVRSHREVAPGVRELVFASSGVRSFQAGQYLELEVSHAHPDSRGTRREFSIVSAPSELPTLRIAYRDGGARPSSFKRALAAVPEGGMVAATGVWGDFVLPRDAASPLLLVAAGIGVTPFVSHLAQSRASGERRDVVLVLVASSADAIAYREELAEAGAPTIVCTPDEPRDLPTGWTWSGGERLSAESLQRLVPDLSSRRAFVSGPPALIADLAPALRRARSLTTDAFAGY